MNSLMAVLKGREMVYDGFERKYFNFFHAITQKNRTIRRIRRIKSKSRLASSSPLSLDSRPPDSL